MQLKGWCGVQAQPAGAGVEAPVTPVRWEEGKKSTVRMRNVLDDVPHPPQAALVVNVLKGG